MRRREICKMKEEEEEEWRSTSERDRASSIRELEREREEGFLRKEQKKRNKSAAVPCTAHGPLIIYLIIITIILAIPLTVPENWHKN
jgi:hypothetical protein